MSNEERANSHANRGDAGAHDTAVPEQRLLLRSTGCCGLGHGVAVLVALPARCD